MKQSNDFSKTQSTTSSSQRTTPKTGQTRQTSSVGGSSVYGAISPEQDKTPAEIPHLMHFLQLAQENMGELLDKLEESLSSILGPEPAAPAVDGHSGPIPQSPLGCAIEAATVRTLTQHNRIEGLLSRLRLV